MVSAAMLDLGLIPAAGEGVRAYPATTRIPKVMLEVEGKPLILRNLEVMRDQLGIRDIVLIVGYLAEQVKAFLGDGERFGVRVRYVDCAEPKIGLAQGVLLAEPLMDRPFAMILGDELYLGSNHEELRPPADGDFFAVCAVKRVDDPRLIRKNYAVFVEDDRIVDLEEKPEQVTTEILGCGSYLFTPKLFDKIRQTPPSARSGRVELTDVIRDAARAREGVHPFFLNGHYFNVNSVVDYNLAHYVSRSRSFADYKVSVVIPAYNEEESIGYVVSDFVPVVDEVLVVDNRSRDRTSEIARAKGARVEQVQLTGYGDTIKWGMDHAIGDILVVVEADHSFRSKDLGKLLEYLKDADMVIGTRTTREMIEQGSNMRGLLRLGNVVVGKLIELLWWSQEPRFTDVGCTYRALWRDTWHRIRDRMHGVGPEFAPEMMIEILRARKRVVEIPVSYYPRVGGESKHSENLLHVSKTALRMLRVIFKKRLGLGR
ncbi:MAG: sugar phosphate nucleotidyltransferase [Planctomycetota bacterium]